jgi:hypothetical protein
MGNDSEHHFNPAHHALLFAWIAGEVLLRAGKERGRKAVSKAIRRYGEQRGRRMALRAEKDHQALDMTTYMAYGEWQAAAGLFDTGTDQIDGSPRSLVFRCPWHEAWISNGINESGRLYCQEIDASLARGFNPDLRLEVKGTRSNGAEACEFVYHQADLEALKRMPVDRSRTVKDWAYHLGHLYKTMRQVLGEELGEIGENSVEAGLVKFAGQFGASAAQAVRRYQAVDFDRLPEDKDE